MTGSFFLPYSCLKEFGLIRQIQICLSFSCKAFTMCHYNEYAITKSKLRAYIKVHKD